MLKRSSATHSLTELAIPNGGFAPGVQPEADAGDDEAGRLALEQAYPVTELAVRRTELQSFERVASQHPHALDHAGDLLPVSADVLNRRCSGRARDAGQTLDARPSSRDGAVDDTFPGNAGARIDGPPGTKIDLIDADSDHQPVESFVRHDQVRPTPEDG